MESPLGRIFTDETFSSYYSFEVLQFLEAEDLQNLRLVNTFCRNLIKDRELWLEIAKRNLMSNRYVLQETLIVETDLTTTWCPGNGFACNSKYLCLIVEDVYIYSASSLKHLYTIPCAKYIGKRRGNFSYYRHCFFLTENNILVINFAKISEFMDYCDLQSSCLMFFNLNTGEIERIMDSYSLKGPLDSLYYIIDKDTITGFGTNCGAVVWNLTTGAQEVTRYEYGTRGVVYKWYLVVQYCQDMKLMNLETKQIESTITSPSPAIQLMSLIKNTVVAITGTPNLIAWFVQFVGVNDRCRDISNGKFEQRLNMQLDIENNYMGAWYCNALRTSCVNEGFYYVISERHQSKSCYKIVEIDYTCAKPRESGLIDLTILSHSEKVNVM